MSSQICRSASTDRWLSLVVGHALVVRSFASEDNEAGMKTLTLCAVLVVLTACSSSAQQARRPAPTDVVATVGSTSITLAEVDDKALEQPASNFGGAKLFQVLYEARSAALDEIVALTLMDDAAKAQGIDRSALVEKEITSKVPAVTEADVAAWYQANQARVQGASLDQVRQPIRAFLTQDRMQTIREQYVETLKAKTTVRVMLDPPRQKVAMDEGEPGARSGRRTDRDRGVFGLSVPVLSAGGPGTHAGSQHLRRSHPARVPPVPAPQPPQRQAGGRGGDVRQRAGEILAVPRSALCQSAAARRQRPQATRGGSRAGCTALQRLPGLAQVPCRSSTSDISAGNDSVSTGRPRSSSTGAC